MEKRSVEKCEDEDGGIDNGGCSIRSNEEDSTSNNSKEMVKTALNDNISPSANGNNENDNDEGDVDGNSMSAVQSIESIGEDPIIEIETANKGDDENDEKAYNADSSNSDETANDSQDEPGLSSGLPPSSSRLMRNLAEKMRRDKLNMYISELSSLVPIVAMATKRMDKTSVLRLSANFLRIHMSLKQDKKVSKLQQTPGGLESTLSSTLLEALEGFMLIITNSGKIVYVSEGVEKLLGHSQLDLMGQSLYTICHSGDTEVLRHHLQPSPDFHPNPSDEGTDGSGTSTDYVPRSPSYFGGRPDEALSGLAAGERRSFYVRLTERSMARGDPARHLTVHLNGILRPPTNKTEIPKTSKGKKDSTSSGTGDEYLLVCVARPLRNKGITELSLMEAVQDEYVTRHLPDGRIIYSDHRIAFVAGYLTEEVMGLSAFNFIHQEDLPWATVANRQMFSSVEGHGYSVYRLRSKTGSLIHLRTRGFLEFNKTTQKVETFVCINTLLTNEEGDKELEKERERIMPFITFQQVTASGITNALTVGKSSTCSSEAGSSSQSVPAQEEDSSILTPPLGIGKSRHSTIQLIQDQLESEELPSAVTVITASIGMCIKSGNIGMSLGNGSSSSSETCTIVEVPPEADEDLGNIPSPPETKLDLTCNGSTYVNGDPSTTIVVDPEDSGDLSNSTAYKHQISSPSLKSPSQSSGLGSPIEIVTQEPSGMDQIHQTLIYVTHQGQLDGNNVGSLSPISELQLEDPILSNTRRSLVTTPSNSKIAFPRLKRSLSDVEDMMVTSSPKRTILPSAFITYNPNPILHHSSHMRPRWGTKPKSTIIYDQHNNNG